MRNVIYAAVVTEMRDAVRRIDPTGETVGRICSKHLHDGDARHRLFAVWTVQIIGEPAHACAADLTRLYREMLSDTDKGFRWKIVLALCSIGDSDAVRREATPVLKIASRNPDDWPETRLAATTTLARWNVQSSAAR